MGVMLDVNGRQVVSTDITYEDLIILYQQFKNKNGRLPTTVEGKSKNNLPQGRIIKRVIEEKGITYNEFMVSLGKVKHVRTENKNYELFLNKYKKISKEIGHALNQLELTNNPYALPSSNWFVKYCPSKEVKSFDDFVIWCGFYSNKSKKDDDFIAQKLIQMEKDLHRPITKNDISLNKCGFSMIVIDRIWGGLSNAKECLGLQKTIPNIGKSFDFYKEQLDRILDVIWKIEKRKFISWTDIENKKYINECTDHKTYIKAFKKANVDFYKYIKEKGFEFRPHSAGNIYTFDNGEVTKSINEYSFSNFLRKELFLKYNIDYIRDVMYKTFSNEKSKINCDYLIKVDNDLELYIELAGMITNYKDDSWRNHQYPSERENNYRDTLIKKENLLKDNCKNYLFLFPSDMKNDKYKTILLNKLKEIQEESKEIQEESEVV